MAGPVVDLGGFFTVTTMTCSVKVSLKRKIKLMSEIMSALIARLSFQSATRDLSKDIPCHICLPQFNVGKVGWFKINKMKHLKFFSLL